MHGPWGQASLGPQISVPCPFKGKGHCLPPPLSQARSSLFHPLHPGASPESIHWLQSLHGRFFCPALACGEHPCFQPLPNSVSPPLPPTGPKGACPVLQRLPPQLRHKQAPEPWAEGWLSKTVTILLCVFLILFLPLQAPYFQTNQLSHTVTPPPSDTPPERSSHYGAMGWVASLDP